MRCHELLRAAIAALSPGITQLTTRALVQEPSSSSRGPGSPSGPVSLINLAYSLCRWRSCIGPSPMEPLPRLLAGSERLQCTSPGHHAAPGSRLQSLQRRWRSFWWHSRNKLRWQGPRARPTTCWPLEAGQSTSCPSHFASAATHNTSPPALHWRNDLAQPSRSCAGGPSLSLITALCLT